MARFAVIENGVVTNLILAEIREDAEAATGCLCVEIPDNSPVAVGDEFVPVEDKPKKVK